jgi:hypothetical protein
MPLKLFLQKEIKFKLIMIFNKKIELKLLLLCRGTFFKNRTKSKIGKKNIFDFHIFDFIFGFLILKLVNR